MKNLKNTGKLVTILLLLLFCTSTSFAQGGVSIFNGVAYVLLPNEFAAPGVYRLNDYNGQPTPVTNPIINLNSMPGKVSGLSANQQGQIFLLAGPIAGDWEDAPVGWLPVGMRFEDDSPIYLKVMLPSEYSRSGMPHNGVGGYYWKVNHSIDGKTYDYAVVFGGPDEVKFLDGVSGTKGTPIWNGVSSDKTGIVHPTDPRKVILPSHWAGAAYYAYGTIHNEDFPSEALDGTIGRNGTLKPLKYWYDGEAGHQHHIDKTLFSCIVKRTYRHRQKTLDLYGANDPGGSPSLQSKGMLASLDVNVSEAYGKYCGDNCIPGGSIGQNDIMTQLSTVKVITSTKGSRYGFNPQGTRWASSWNDENKAINAALRVVLANNPSKTVAMNVAAAEGSDNFASAIANAGYLQGRGITPSTMKSLGVSSDFSNVAGLDYVYGSDADRFVVQDSWWGRGGIAYEYYENTGLIQKLDYINNSVPQPEALGFLAGKVDDIGIDGEGYLYVLRSAMLPSDSEMQGMDVDPDKPNKADRFFSITENWYRPKDGGDGDYTAGADLISEGNQQPGDFKVVTLFQDVRKTVKRYPQATGALGAEEDRESVFAGYDYWERRLEYQGGGAVAWMGSAWRSQPDEERISNMPAELAIVNLAKLPAIQTPANTNPSLMVVETAAPHVPVNTENHQFSIPENETITFKVEGYRPFVNGEYQSLKAVGAILNRTGHPASLENLTNVTLNSVPAIDGSFNHDENGDGVTSGFPSSMFESTERNTTFTWKVTRVEDRAGDKQLSDKIGETMTYTDLGSPNKGMKSYKFKPGNYMVQATVQYNILDFESSSLSETSRPDSVPIVEKTALSRTFLVKVYSQHLAVNQTPSFITDVQIVPEINAAGGRVSKGVAAITGGHDEIVHSDNSNIDFAEDEDYTDPVTIGSFKGISFSFNAQFVRDNPSADSGTPGPDTVLRTYDGIGVWDYLYYTRLFNQMKNGISALSNYDVGVTNTSELATAHVYNYIPAGDPSNVAAKIDLNIYNPGRPKAHDTGKADKGTQVSGDPTSKDWTYVQWGLYLSPTDPYAVAVPTSDLASNDAAHDRGILVASGNVGNDISASRATISPLGNRRYNVNVKVSKEQLEAIRTPKDPHIYQLHLELIYPRVSWKNNDLDDDSAELRFSSIVPYYYEEQGRHLPFHAVSRMHLFGGGESADNSLISRNSHMSSTGPDLFVGGRDFIGIMARDATLPEKPIYQGSTEPIIQTTGDRAGDVLVAFGVRDNNPHAILTKGFKAAYQTIRNPGNPFDLSEENKRFEKIDIPEDDVVENLGPITTSYFKDDTWKHGASFSVVIADYGRESEFDAGGNYSSWVGTLSYVVLGNVYDGIGTDSLNLTHSFYHAAAASDLGDIPVANRINVDSQALALQRYDNDPPNIKVELISQADNRRWLFDLEEKENDVVVEGVYVPKNSNELAPSTLTVSEFNLQDGMSAIPIFTKTDKTIEGTSAYPKPMGEPTVNVLSAFSDDPAVVPTFRRASRILIHVHILDNTGYQPLGAATISVNNSNGESLLSNSDIPLIPSLETSGQLRLEFQDDRPRATFAVDMPMRVEEGNQVTITVMAEDLQGNKRELIIPVRVVESTFDTRVLESSEQRN